MGPGAVDPTLTPSRQFRRADESAGRVEGSFRRSLRRAMILPVVVLTAGSIFMAVMVLYLRNLHHWVDHTDVVIGRTSWLQHLTAQEESALRGYLLSRDALFLRQFNEVDLSLSPAFDELQGLVADDPSQVQALRDARVEVIRFRHYAAQQMDRVFEGASAETIGTHLRAGLAISDRISAIVKRFVDAERQLRASRAQRADELTWYLLVFGVSLGLLLGGAVALATARQMRIVRQKYVEVLDEQRRTQDALGAANQRLREADRHKDEFLGVLSHELRNPLAPIRNCVHVLQWASAGSEQAHRARAILARQVDHLARLVEDLLDLKRLSAGKMRLSPGRMDLAAVARETVEDLRPLFVQRSLHLEISVPETPLWVNGDAVRLEQVVANLLQNAAKFTDAGGHVSVLLDEHDGKARLLVKDDGVGIAPELLPEVFVPFVQGQQALERSRAGLGLGLALVQGIVDLHGGSVSVRSQGVGTGTEFEVQLPVAKAPVVTFAKAEPAGLGASRRRVLVIEDNEDAAASLRDIVELAGGHEVFVAHDGAEGVTAARHLHPDVILCDLGLPRMDGYEVARQLRASGDASDTTLVAVSGYAAADDVERAADAGFDRHLAKPADVETLLRIIAEAPSRSHVRA